MVNAEGIFKCVQVFDQQAAGFIRLEEPFVRVQADGISPFDPAQEFFALFGHDRETAVRSINV